MNYKITCLIFSATVLLTFSSWALAQDDRHTTVDQAIGGMEQGSRIQPPGNTNPITDIHKTIFSSQGSERKAADSMKPVDKINHGYINSNAGNIEQTPDTNESPAQDTSTVDNGGDETNPSVGVETEEAGTDTGEIEDTPTETGATTSEPEPTEDVSQPIIDTDVSADLDSGTVETDVTVDTSGELEDKEIFEADLEAETTTESSSTSDNPIVDTDVSADLESGTVEADATVDTSGELEEKQIVDADLAIEETTTETEVGSATDVTGSDIVEDADVTTEPVQTISPPSNITAEVDTTGATTGGEADVGVEADVSGVSEAEDVVCDPTDGLISDACGVPQL